MACAMSCGLRSTMVERAKEPGSQTISGGGQSRCCQQAVVPANQRSQRLSRRDAADLGQRCVQTGAGQPLLHGDGQRVAWIVEAQRGGDCPGQRGRLPASLLNQPRGAHQPVGRAELAQGIAAQPQHGVAQRAVGEAAGQVGDVRVQPGGIHVVRGDDAGLALSQRFFEQRADGRVCQRLPAELVAAQVAEVSQHRVPAVMDVELARGVSREVVARLQSHHRRHRPDPGARGPPAAPCTVRR